MIPKIIWQTYETKYDLLPQEAINNSKTWKILNPDWEYRYMDSIDRSSFVLKYFGNEWFNIFNDSINIAKANIWRCMVLYIYGGVYADLDAVCNRPISSWIKNNYEMVLCRDYQANVKDFAIYTFASKPNSIGLKKILEQIKINISSNMVSKENVIDLTGETVWRNVLDTNIKEYNIYVYENENSNLFDGIAVSHAGPIKKWPNYIQWTE